MALPCRPTNFTAENSLAIEVEQSPHHNTVTARTTNAASSAGRG
jgi:hypothetical protein